MHGQRQQEPLALDPRLDPFRAKAFVEDALVGGMLVDQYEAFFGLDREVGGEQLAEQRKRSEAHACHDVRRGVCGLGTTASLP